MPSPALSYGIPDVILPRIGGGMINPAAFVGHELVVFFCPADPVDAQAEILAYQRLLPGFEEGGAWVVGVLPEGELPTGSDFIPLALDRDGTAWSGFASLAEEEGIDAAQRTGAFLFGRGGCLNHAWAGAGNAEKVLAALRERQ